VPGHVTLVTGDFLTTDVAGLLGGLMPSLPPGSAPAADGRRRYRLVGNLPYNLTSPILERLVELQQRSLFADATLMVQREVAERLAARAGTKAYGAMTVLVRRHAVAERILDLPPGAFSPRPKVHSSVIRLRFNAEPVPVLDEEAFARLVKALFSQRRKTLANAIARFDRHGRAALSLSGLDPRRRPETLQVQDIARLAELIRAASRPDMV
jgi:16S rRNA (adenine1518-N6/adenine1519-N6)-dimethyltransferase